MAMEIEIEPEMIVALDELPLSRPTRSATANALVPPPAPVAPKAPSFFNIPIAGSSTSIPPPVFARGPARGTSITTPRLFSKRPSAPKGPDSTWLVSPLPPPAPPSMHSAVLEASKPHRRVPRNWVTVGLSAVATGLASATILLLVSSRHPDVAPSRVAPDSVAPVAHPGSPPESAPPRAVPSKQTAGKPAPRPRPRVATNLDAKLVTPATKPPATNLQTKSAAPSAKKPALAVARERATTPSAKPVAPAPKLPTKIDAKVVAQPTKKPVAPAPPAIPASRTSASASTKLATRTQPSAADDTKAAPPAKPATKIAPKAQNKAVASVDPKPVVTPKKPATR